MRLLDRLLQFGVIAPQLISIICFDVLNLGYEKKIMIS